MLLGEVIAERFELAQLAQVGGMGAVYRAKDRLTGQDVALKMLRDPGGGHDQRFLREAALLAELRHPGIVLHVAHGRTARGDLYLAMEWLEGEDLSRRLVRGALAAGEAIALARRAADALSLLHARGGLHRDLKPANLFLEDGKPERVKLLDFGIARAASGLGDTHTGTIMGTPGYTAPEQARGARDIDARADVFALGCVLYECLTGRAAFRGDHAMAVLARILLEEPRRLIELAPDAPAALDNLVARMLDKDPSRRPRDAGEVRDLLDEIGTATLRPNSPLTPRPPTLGSDEQRFMCLVLCTVPEEASSLAAAETLPPMVPLGVEPTLIPEAAPSLERLAALVRSHGARLERLADGSWVALADRAAALAPATDQAQQAARVGLALSRILPTARIAIAAGRGVQAGRAPVGDVIDRALALVSAGTGIWVDALSAGLLGAGFELKDQGTLRLVAEHADAEQQRRILGRPTPCIGRDRELATMIGLFDDCVTEPCARAVLVRGPAGHGKSRLRTELQARLRARGVAFEWLYGRGDPLRAGAPFAIAAQVVRRAAGLVEGEPVAARKNRVAARIASVVAEADRERVTAFLGELVRIPTDDAGTALAAARRDPLVMGDQLRRAWEDWLAAETERRPVILVLDDLHLGDLSSVKLVDSALRNLREQPLFVLALARPEIELVFPGMWADRGVVTIPLAELSRKASTRLVREILGNEDEAVVERIVRQADGNAFYLEELCRVTRDGHGGELPGTVLAMAQARLESLDAESRRLLRAASVFGARFPRGGVLALWGDVEDAATVDRMLSHLVEAELLEPASTEFLGERSYVFRHALVREAAYAMLTDADRRLGHRLAAAWLAAAGSLDRVLLAEHFERGGQPERAIEGYLAAAREALQGNDLAAVLTRVERGLACGAGGAELGGLLALRAEALRWRAEYSAAHEAAALAMAVLTPGATDWCTAAMTAQAALGALDAHDRLDDLLTRVVDAPPLDPTLRLQTLGKLAVHFYLSGRYPRADQLSAHIDAEVARAWPTDPLLEARVLEVRSFREAARGEQGRSLELLEGTAAAFLRAGDLRNACLTHNNLGYTLIQLGAYTRAVSLLENALRDAERMAIPYARVLIEENLGVALTCRGQRARAEALLRHAFEEFRRQNDLHLAAVSRTHRAQLFLANGDPAAAVREAELALEWLAEQPPSRALALATLARARVALGDGAAALVPARDAFTILETLGTLDEGEMLVRLALAEALAAGGRAAEARAVVRVACDRIDHLTTRLDAELAQSYRRDVAEHAALLALASLP